MKKVSQITEEICIAFDHIAKLKQQLAEAWETLDRLRKELDHHIKFNRTIKLN